MEEKQTSEIKRQNSKFGKRVSSLPPDENTKVKKNVVPKKKSTLAYENNILVEETDPSSENSNNNLFRHSENKIIKPLPTPNVTTFIRRPTMKPYIVEEIPTKEVRNTDRSSL